MPHFSNLGHFQEHIKVYCIFDVGRKSSGPPPVSRSEHPEMVNYASMHQFFTGVFGPVIAILQKFSIWSLLLEGSVYNSDSGVPLNLFEHYFYCFWKKQVIGIQLADEYSSAELNCSVRSPSNTLIFLVNPPYSRVFQKFSSSCFNVPSSEPSTAIHTSISSNI